MKAVLLSIKPEFCELIASGKKTIEVRKSEPKLKTPFKCYIYETKAINHQKILVDLDGNLPTIYAKGSGKVIGEFVCDRIVKAECGQYCRFLSVLYTQILPQELFNYANYKPVYGWHISDLKIYDKPKELSEFTKYNRHCEYDNMPFLRPNDCNQCVGCRIEKPPQSWGYVEEQEA